MFSDMTVKSEPQALPGQRESPRAPPEGTWRAFECPRGAPEGGGPTMEGGSHHGGAGFHECSRPCTVFIYIYIEREREMDYMDYMVYIYMYINGICVYIYI